MEKAFLSDHRSQIIARIKVKGKNFEILVDLNKSLELKKTGKGFMQDILIFDGIFSDFKKGLKVKENELKNSFGTTDIYKVAEKIIRNGELLLPLEYKTKEREAKIKQIVEWLSKNCINPQTSLPHPPDRIKSAIDQVGVKIEEAKSAQVQAPAVLKLIQKILPIKIETKRLAIKVTPAYTGRTYGLLREFMLKEEWIADGSLSCVIEIPSASLSDFFDKLNSLTHGTALTKEIPK